MTNRIDCSVQSHSACYDPEEPVAQAPPANDSRPAPAPEPSYYDCMDDCISSLGVAQLVASALTGLGCYTAPPACPVLIGGAAGAITGWCDAQCDKPAPAPSPLPSPSPGGDR